MNFEFIKLDAIDIIPFLMITYCGNTSCSEFNISIRAGFLWWTILFEFWER